jgi:S1-C subfamily serine protease
MLSFRHRALIGGVVLLVFSLLAFSLRAAQTQPETLAHGPLAAVVTPGVPTLNPTHPAPTLTNPGAAPATTTPAPVLPGTVVAPGAATAPGLVSPGTSAMPPVAPPQGTPLPEGSEPEKSVVQIINAYQEPDWASPWIFDEPHGASGTGFLIDGNRIMTNAHVVAWAKELLVRKYHDPQKYIAHVEFVANDIDLAVLKIDDPDFAVGMKPLDFGPLPKVRSQVITYGFPAGGEQISYTRGVVSRIEVEDYVHIGNRAFLAVQTDAAINPGNSGGPVIQDDKVVGVAFEGLPGLQSTGYFIPTLIIRHFLDDIKDGTYDGEPEAGLRLASLQNPAYRSLLKMPADSKRGVRVDQILDLPTTKAVLKPDDVLMQVGDYPVDDDGTITYEGNTVGVSVAFDMAQNNDVLPLKVWRDGKMIDVNLPMTVYQADYAQGNQYDVLPRYYIYGGLVFTTLSLDYLKTFGHDWNESVGRDLIYELAYRHVEDPKNWRPEPVVLASILNAPVNANFSVRGQAMIDKINGIRIDRLSDVPKAFAAGAGPDAIIEFLPDHHFEVIRKDEAEKETADILGTYGVPAQSRL